MQDTVQTPISKKSFARYLLVVLAIVLAVSSICVYMWQSSKLNDYKEQGTTLSAQLSSLKQKAQQLQSAGTISTVGWKTYCDPYNNYCFQYPDGWKLVQSNDSADSMVQVNIINPGNTLSVIYNDNQNKDTFPVSFHTDSINGISSSSPALSVVGGYYLSSVQYQPFYAAVGTSQIDGSSNALRADTTSTWTTTPIIEEGEGALQDLQFEVAATNPPLTSTQSVDAWFQSVNGKTALQIVKSFYNKQ